MNIDSQRNDANAACDVALASDDLLELAPASLISLILHLLVLIILALFTLRSKETDLIQITLSQGSLEAALELESIVIESVDLETTDSLDQVSDVTMPVEIVDTGIELAAFEKPATNAQGDALTSFSAPKLRNISEEFARIIFDAQEHGIEIVIVFDSTGSMSGEIGAVKQRIGAISRSVMEKIPQARFSLVTYRDRGDDYLVRGIQLDSDIVNITRFTMGVVADGGGDTPEALKDGMSWAVSQNDYRPYSRKAMLIFGDAPPHRHELGDCLRLAADFQAQEKAVVHTISCRQTVPIHEFYLIATAGGGRAFVMHDVRGLMEELLILAFGPEHRDDVLKYFELDGPQVPPQPNRPRFRRRGTRDAR